MYKYAILDPRNVPAAQAANGQVFASAEHGVLGIEVTVPALAARCGLGNIDPQHSEGNRHLAAIEAALTAEVPAEGTTLATVRADLDAVGAMTVMKLRRAGRIVSGLVDGRCPLCGASASPSRCIECNWDGEWAMPGYGMEPVAKRLVLVARADKFARDEWPGQRPLPTRDNPWPTEGAVSETRELAAIAAAVADHKAPLAERVATMEKWLLTGEEPEQCRAQVERERLDLIEALEAGQIKYETCSNGKVAVVESTHRAATSVGYCFAPVVVAINPEFRLGGGEPHRKFTICQYNTGYVNMNEGLLKLNELEQGWGGSPTIIGSPQGVSSALTTEQVVGVVEKRLL